MDDIEYTEFTSNQLLLISGLKNTLDTILPQLISKSAMQNTLTVLDAGNSYREYIIARELKKYTEKVNNCLNHIIHYQISNIQQLLTKVETMGDPRTPVFILDILTPFYPDIGSIVERERNLHRVMDTISRISKKNCVVISCSQSNNQYYQDWFANIRQYADQILYQDQSQGPENYELF